MIRPLNDYVVLQAVEEEQITASGIYLGSTRNKQPMGKVVAVKETYSCDYMGEITSYKIVNVGDVVYYKTGVEIKDGDEAYILVKEADLMAVVDRGER